MPIDREARPQGEELASRIVNLLRDHAIDASPPENYDDFAWSSDIRLGDANPWLLIGFVGDDDYQWLAQIHSGFSWFGRLLGKSDEAARNVLATTLHDVLSTSAEFTTVRWHEGEFGEGWSASPTGDAR